MARTRSRDLRIKAKKAQPPGTTGRPPLLTQAAQDKLLDYMCDGKSLNKACKMLGINVSTVLRKVAADPGFRELYVQAQNCKAEVQFEELVDLADEAERPTGKGKPGARLFDNVERARLRVETRKWTITKGFAKKYGDKADLNIKSTTKIIYADEEDRNA